MQPNELRAKTLKVYTPDERFLELYQDRQEIVESVMNRFARATLDGKVNAKFGGIVVSVPEAFQLNPKEFDPFEYEFASFICRTYHRHGWEVIRCSYFMDKFIMKPVSISNVYS